MAAARRIAAAPTTVLAWLKTALRASHEDEYLFQHSAIECLQTQYASHQRKLDLAYDDRLDGRLSLNRYEEKATGLREEMAHARAELARHENADRAYTEEGIALAKLAGMALELWESQDAPERRQLLDSLCLNTEFRDDGLSVTWKKPFDALAQSNETANNLGVTFDESSDAHQVWLRKAVRSRNWTGVDARLDLRVQRLLTLHREPRVVAPAVVRAKVSVLARAGVGGDDPAGGDRQPGWAGGEAGGE